MECGRCNAVITQISDDPMSADGTQILCQSCKAAENTALGIPTVVTDSKLQIPQSSQMQMQMPQQQMMSQQQMMPQQQFAPHMPMQVPPKAPPRDPLIEASVALRPSRQVSDKRYTGTVKWYRPNQEKGVIESRDLRELNALDAVVLQSNLEGVVPCAGDVCTFRVAKTRCGWKAVDMIWVGGQGAAEREAKATQAQLQIHEGKILSFDCQKGFGFLGCEALRPLFNKDVFFMKTHLHGSYEAYQVGMSVYFRCRVDDKRIQASAISLNRSDLEKMPNIGQLPPMGNMPPMMGQMPQMQLPSATSTASQPALEGAGPIRRKKSKWDDDAGPY
eukprot:gnl/MRDRNA2_/MRDRNA2_100012_c0_seq1.p1 gnl/MRDRNA2_/MRDRNA2_100012_c0~~gnl/MRDRNA2_/MRDRNA2_100012_c0_seq1.p1  ORF type:complete len:332 (+),score=66.57 gnl/MRDRNA2_/MRDRNA2_100012_c0_seq1:98-1093(+)